MATFAIRVAIVVGLGVACSGCSRGWGCDGWEKISPSRSDTAGTKKQVLEHNLFGSKQGCWK